MVADSPEGQRRRRRSLLAGAGGRPFRLAGRLTRPLRHLVAAISSIGTSSLTRRIVILNLAATIALVGGILYLNKFRAGLIDARVESLLTQGQIIAAAIAAQATASTDAITIDPNKLLDLQAGESGSPYDSGEANADFPINPEQVAPVLTRLISPTRTRARIYDQDGTLLLDSRALYARGQILQFDLPPPFARKSLPERWWEGFKRWWRVGDLPAYHEIGAANGKQYPEVATSLSGSPASVVRVGEDGGLIVSVAVPVQRFRGVLGSLLLSTQSGDIDKIVAAERMAIVRVAVVATAVTMLLSLLLASTIAGPVRRLAAAADRVRRVKRRIEIPNFGDRKDEIGHLARAFSDMTTALYNRMDAIETFAADVSHELKNPLTSLRSAVETLPIARTDEQRERLLAIIKHDIRRLDRLITDISDASRLDAELAREDAEPVDVHRLIETVVFALQETRVDRPERLQLRVEPGRFGKDAFFVFGHDSRLGQIFNNLIDNALSFSPPDGEIRVLARREAASVLVTVDDDGPGIRAENIESIFERFYTDRPEGEAFGQNSGLGLAITRQIAEAHRGTVRAENRVAEDGTVRGARFIVTLPSAGA
ncbi:two-component system, OmpR family, sensor histidine kinase ChvG [Faunimonas pinastri]|uniref:histidine kinase n=1 Tax=Faunimonas pinastri TaxID=1855383 RepID=A0A1H9PS10_9HYPH|nr:sensor histidine kinase [Faunimonas pinastri]SER51017.1 two-component system, OmpR family, sensor histidine kinase ChvG [Faunimonas pinastri]